MPRGGGQGGQATIEWAGLMLCVALIFGALLAGGRSAAEGEAGRGLGEAVAERITCAVRGACEAEEGARGSGRVGERRPGSGAAQGGERGASQGGERGAAQGGERGAAQGGERGRLGRGVARGAPLGPGGRLSLLSPSQGGHSRLRGALRAVAGSPRLLRRTWFACLAYRSWQDDREHPRLLGEARPVKRTLHMLNECVNPLSFLFGK